MTTVQTHPSEDKIKETQTDLDNIVTALNSASITTPSIAQKKRPQLRSGKATTVTARLNETIENILP